jgi:hypothetical protein
MTTEIVTKAEEVKEAMQKKGFMFHGNFTNPETKSIIIQRWRYKQHIVLLEIFIDSAEFGFFTDNRKLYEIEECINFINSL